MIKKFLVTADIHAHTYSQFAVPDPKYGTNRLKVIVACLMQMLAYAKKHKIDTLIIIGDLFHVRGLISTVVFKVMHNTLKMFKEYGIRVIIVAGNHDQANKAGTVTALTGFEGVAHIIEWPVVVSNCAFIPYTEDTEALQEFLKDKSMKRVDYIFAHLAVDGAEVSASEYQPKEMVTLDMLPYKDVEWVFLGHYHKSQSLAKNVMYVGNLCHLNFGDSGLQKGFWCWDGGPKFVATQYPEFITLKINNEKELREFRDKIYSETDYYRLTLGIDAVIRYDNVITIHSESKDKPKIRVKGIEKMKDEDSIRAYVDYQVIDRPKQEIDALMAVGEEIMKRARGRQYGVQEHDSDEFHEVVRRHVQPKQRRRAKSHRGKKR